MLSRTTEEVCRSLEWDSRFFGINIGRVNGSRLAKEQMASLLDWCRAQEIDCLYLLADSGHQETSELAAQHGFQLVDIRLTLEHGSFGPAASVSSTNACACASTACHASGDRSSPTSASA